MAKTLKPRALVPMGDCAVYIEFSEKLDLEVNEAVQRLALAVHAQGLPWVRGVVPALGGIAVHFDPDHPEVHGDALQASEHVVMECLKAGLPEAQANAEVVEVPVCYDPQFAPDIAEVAALTGMSVSDVARRHAAAEYRVLMIGFAPGHAYMAGLDPKLAVPRRAAPRALVAPGAVAIANDQTVVYPYAISGGWSIIGRTPLAVFDAARGKPSLFSAGDRVRFVPISAEVFEKHAP